MEILNTWTNWKQCQHYLMKQISIMWDSLLSERTNDAKCFQEVCGKWKRKTQVSVHISRMNDFFFEEEQPLCEHNRQSLKVKPTAHIPESSQKDQIIRTADITWSNKQEGGDIKICLSTVNEKRIRANTNN